MGRTGLGHHSRHDDSHNVFPPLTHVRFADPRAGVYGTSRRRKAAVESRTATARNAAR
jgi:hypothetical protein